MGDDFLAEAIRRGPHFHQTEGRGVGIVRRILGVALRLIAPEGPGVPMEGLDCCAKPHLRRGSVEWG